MAKFRLTRDVSIDVSDDGKVKVGFSKGFVFEGDAAPTRWGSITLDVYTYYGTLRVTFLDYEYEYVNQAPLYLRERKIVALPVGK